MKAISALIKGPPRGPSLHLPWKDPVRKSPAEAPPESARRAPGLDIQPADGEE